MPDDYKYDVFFSYKRHDLTLGWTRQVHRRFQFWLAQELGGNASVFVDEECIETGQEWPQVLEEALMHSRCMVCVWSPSYFQSSWCLSEWRTFLEREKVLGIRPRGLIAPMRFHDGEHFPEEAKRTQWVDVAQYATTLPAFWETERAIELESLLKILAHDVAGIVRNAPGFRPDWPIIKSQGLAQPHIELERL